ncbi:MAG: phenylalanine--tRNA ligase subunit beta, partial [Thermoanaerobaculia bacterium]|nr:phenylalanine--tRNA ligase subunit beta [Thermoanaerobaculia bacterium]
EVDDASLADALTSIGHAVEGSEEIDGDIVLEIEFTANRLDAMSHMGLARELSAALDRPLAEVGTELEINTLSALPVSIENPDMCSRYVATLIRNVEVGPSDERTRKRLEAVGQRPINNIVDITNYVMLATGHPLHAFDYDRLAGGEIVVRAARKDEELETLDEVERTLNPSDCVIADRDRAVALGGVIGGANSEIDQSTRHVLLECAHFDPVTIRRTAKRMGISTDASYRFERSVDPGDAAFVSRMAAEMIGVSGSAKIEGMKDVVAREIHPLSIILRKERLDLFSSSTIPFDEAERILDRLGMEITAREELLEVVVPTWRSDITDEIDLIEEVLRIHGYGRIPSSLPRLSTGDVHREEGRDLGEAVRDVMRGFGLTEVITYSFLDPEENRRASEEEPPPLTNALTRNISVMRSSVIPGLLQVLERNVSYGTRDGGIFEVGRTYHLADGKLEERDVVSFLLYGTIDATSKREVDYLDVKGVVEELGERFRTDLRFRAGARPWSKEEHGAEVELDGSVVGFVGVVEPELVRARGYRGTVVAGEISLEPLRGAEEGWRMTPVSRFPGVPMVLALMHDAELAYEDLEKEIESLEVANLREVGLWDRFQPKESDRIKTTLAMWYQADERSLTQEEVTEEHEKLSKEIIERLPVELA